MAFLFSVYTHLIKQIEIGLWLLHRIAVIIQFKCRSAGNKIDFFPVLLGDHRLLVCWLNFLIRFVGRKVRLVVVVVLFS